MSRISRLMLLNVLGGGAAVEAGESPITTYYDDNFSVNEAAPMVSPHTADVAGTATILDTTSKLLTNGGYLKTTGSFAVNDPQIYDAQRSNAAGLYMYWKQETRDTTTSNGYFGLSSVVNANATNPLGWKDAFNIVQPYVNFTAFDSNLTNGLAVSTTYAYVPNYIENLLVSTNPGAIWLQRHVQGQWMVIYADETLTNATLYGRLQSQGKLFFGDKMKTGAFSSSGMFANFHAMATAFTGTTSNGSTLVGDANGVIRHTITAATGVTQELMFRRVDDNNCWIVRMDQTGSKIYLYEKVSGTETERGATGGTAQTWTNGTQYKIQVTADYRHIRVSVNAAHKVAYTVATTNMTTTGIKVSHAGINLMSIPRRLSIAGFTSAVQNAILPIGDSKTAGQGDSNPPPLGENGYPYYLTQSLGPTWKETPRVGVGGSTAAILKARCDADIAARYDAPKFILFDIGANDVAAMPSQASFEADYGYMLDAWHERFPSARMGLALVGRQGFDTNCNTLAGYIANIIAARSSYAFTGPDERIILKGADNYVTNTVDGLHPNSTGYTLMAAGWRTAMGI